jgi:hypothetical protein
MARTLSRLAPLAKRWLGAVLAPAADPRTLPVEGAPQGAVWDVARHQQLLAQVGAARRTTDAARAHLEGRVAALQADGQCAATASLLRHLEHVEAQQRRLAEVEARLASQIEALHAQREAAQVQAQAAAALEEVWLELDGIGAAVTQAEQASEQLAARLQAMDDLTTSDLFAPPPPRRRGHPSPPQHLEPS